MNVQLEAGSLVSMTEIKINIPKGANERVRGLILTKSIRWVNVRSQAQVQLLTAGET